MAMTYDMRGPGAAGGSALVGAASAAERARAFAAARRHSALVKVLRLGLPAGAILITATYGLMLTSGWKIGVGRLNVGQVQVTADDLTMKNPSYFGVTNDGGRYEVRAKKAILEFSQHAPIKLVEIDGDLVQPNSVVTKLKAKHGLLDNAKSQLELYDGIEIDASNGLKARMSRATIYSKEHRVVSKHPVTLAMPTGTVEGATMAMNTNTREAVIAGDVKVHLIPSSQPGQTSAGFGRDAKQPVDVTSERLFINDTSRIAQFTGSVVAAQGDTVLRTPELLISYEGKAATQLAGQAAEQQAEGSRLTRLVAKNGAVITAGADRRIASDQADFDAKADTALFTGNVLINQQKNVLQGRRLFVDRKAGRSRLDAPAEGGQPAGRIAATFYQSENRGPPQAAKAKSAGAEVAAAVQGSMMGSFKTDPNAPIDIDADTLDLNDGAKQAIFRGNVKAQQGEFVMRTVELSVFYTGQSAMGMAGTESAGAKAPAQLTRVEAKQKVLITSKDGQTATGDWAIFDVKANTVLLGGRVIVSRGKDVAEGPRLKIDLTTGMYRFEVENEPATAAAPAVSALPPATAAQPQPPSPTNSASPTGRACPPGKQCLLLYPKDAQDRAKGAIKKIAPLARSWASLG
ncbi:MAG: LPS export ABC transporter periplasmic protein LptC [Hyphomicrobiaceae bacterium]|nr:MAG: LPS export ABC transporter periplasmic protein LptC [Hyphomicrobiaceae bacterium]